MCYRALQRQPVWQILICLLVVGIGSTAFGGAISYTTQVGEDVIFEDILETPTPDNGSLYGPPTVSCNSLVFYPVSFKAVSLVGIPSIDFVDGQLNLTISAINGATISSLTIWEMGDYTLAGTGTVATTVGSGLAMTSVRVEKLNRPIAPGIDRNIDEATEMVFTPNKTETFNLVDDGGIATVWKRSVTIEIPERLAGATQITIVLNDTLTATSENGSVAFVAKKVFGVDVDTAMVPEPSTLILLVLGGAGLLLRGRRRSR